MTILFDQLGLDSPDAKRIGQLVSDYDSNLSLRRIPGGDPIAEFAARQKPRHEYGVYEERIGRPDQQSHWVFTFPASMLDNRVLARIIEADYLRQGAGERIARDKAKRAAEELAIRKAAAERVEALRDEMLGIADLAQRKSTFRHRIGGEDYIVGDTLRKVRKTI